MLDRFHKISEIVGAIALVMSLIFVGIQISQNTAATRASNAQAALGSWSEQGLAIATNERLNRKLTEQIYPELAELYNINEDQMMVDQLTILGLRAVETNYIQWQKGNLSDEIWSGYEYAMVQNFVAYRNFNQIWNNIRQNKSPEMRDYFDALQNRAKVLREYIIAHGGPPPSIQ